MLIINSFLSHLSLFDNNIVGLSGHQYVQSLSSLQLPPSTPYKATDNYSTISLIQLNCLSKYCAISATTVDGPRDMSQSPSVVQQNSIIRPFMTKYA